jgi:ADP-heptose:LPS heptosyltransferase
MIRHPLVVRFGALGDMVLMTVAIRMLHSRFDAPVDILSSGDWTMPLLRDQPGVGNIFLIRSRRQPFLLAPDQWRLVGDLRRRGPGPTWLFDARNDKIERLLERAGWHAEDLVSVDQLPEIRGEHFCDHWRRFALLDPPQLGGQQHAADAAPAFAELQIRARDRCELVAWLRGRGLADRTFILIQVGNKRTMRRGDRRRPSNTKYWPEERWATVLRGLRALHPEHALLLTGVVPEAALNDQILALAAVTDSHNLAREMTAGRLMALTEGAIGMVSVDTGPAHVAAAVGCPAVVLFDSIPKVTMYAPRGPRQWAYCLTGPQGTITSLLDITPEQVLAAWRSIVGYDRH